MNVGFKGEGGKYVNQTEKPSCEFLDNLLIKIFDDFFRSLHNSKHVSGLYSGTDKVGIWW